jgi:glycosyltransferase involved in cell wall biosynthesis
VCSLALTYAFASNGAAVWAGLLCLIGLVWLRRHMALNRAHLEPILSESDAKSDVDTCPTLTVLVAAKDEEANIGACLDGLLRQDYPDLKIVVVNDRSTDRTATIIDEFAAREPRVTALHVRELPPGWGGKSHALHVGMTAATGEYVCFTDADCRFHAPWLMRAAVRFAQRDRTDLLSVLPHLDADSFWEHVVQPPAGAILVFWYPPEKVNNPASPRAYANGAFMLLPRTSYDHIGGHAAIRGMMSEDTQLAYRIKQHGLRLRVIRGGDAYSVRMYTGLREIWRGWTRIFYGCFGTWGRTILGALFLLIFSLAPLLSLLIAPFLPVGGGLVAAGAVAALVAQQTILWRFYALSGTPRPWALTYPLGAGLCLAMVINSMGRLLGVRTQWRGTSYAGGERGAGTG